MRLRVVAFAAMAACAVCLFGGSAHAADAPLVAIADADPLNLAAVVWRIGDDRVLAELGGGVSVPRRLAAIRAARWMRAPEQALQPLVALVRQRDPELARAAVRTVAAIARALDSDAIARREVLISDLAAVRGELSKLAEAERLPADVRALAAGASLALELLGVRP